MNSNGGREWYSLGTLGGHNGELSMSYWSDNTVSFVASVPGDKRRGNISLQVSAGALRDLLQRLDQAAETAKRKKEAAPELVEMGERILVTMANTTLSVPKDVFNRLARLAAAGDNDAALRGIRDALPSLTVDAVRELAFILYSHMRPRVG